ncbi:hypothetical protein LY474_27575 [Myxococcus stipitatus]|uniref:hypothetical protein n=1 Tax=Myxococcus stipitatus TaxID=83455 RepID=UPI001F299FCF|nr:hypothetical protein [Myxococcus stipitatus]MCE9671572.1 hypothetical protein [Myxococcus stipitatus]
MLRVLGCLGMLSGAVLILGAVLSACANVLLLARERTTQVLPTFIFAAITVGIPFLLGRFLWKKGLSSWERSKPSHWTSPTSVSEAFSEERLADFIRAKEEVTVADVAGFCQVSEQQAERMIRNLITRNEINRVFDLEKKAYVVPHFTPGRTPAASSPTIVVPDFVSVWPSTNPQPQPNVAEPAPIVHMSGGNPISSSGVQVSLRSLGHRCPSCNAPQDIDGARPGDKRLCPYCDIAFQVVDASANS